MATKYRYSAWVADFETSTEKWYKDKGYTEIWAFALTNCNINRKTQNILTDDAIVYTNKGLEGDPFDLFIEAISAHCADGDKIYFHNLKFDGRFLLSALLDRGFEDVTNEWNTHVDRKRVNDRQFSALVSGGAWYSIRVRIGEKEFEFRDSAKRIPMTVEAMPREYHLPILKGSIDYDRDPALPVSDLEEKYIRHDVLIVAEVLRMQYQEGFHQLTTAGYAFAEYKKWLKARGLSFDELFPALDPAVEAFCRRGYDGGEVLANPRWAGRVVGDPTSAIKIGDTWDINSMYPAVMSAFPMPVGHPQLTTVEELGLPLDASAFRAFRGSDHRYFVSVRSAKVRVKPGKLPSIGLVVGLGKRCYPEQWVMLTEQVFADVRFEMLLSDYEIKDAELGAVAVFEARDDLFYEYLQAIVAEKNQAAIEGNVMRKALAKVKMNSLYGKFGQKSVSVSCYFDMLDGEMESHNYESAAGSKYVPVAAIITAEARFLLISQANKFTSAATAYMDTDSLHIINGYHNVQPWRRRPLPKGKLEKYDQMADVLTQEQLRHQLLEFEYGRPNEVWCDEFDLGAFKVEGQFACAKWIRAKTYIEGTIATPGEVEAFFKEVEDGDWNHQEFMIPNKLPNPDYYLSGCVKGAGVPDEQKLTVSIENFNIGLVFEGKLMPKNVKGGVILVKSVYEIKDDRTVLTNGDV